MSAWKAYKALLTKRENLVKAMQDPRVKTTIRAQMASPAPPLGPALGQRGVNVGNFCKEFNTVTESFKNATILPVTVHVKPDRTYEIEIETPTTKWLLMQAAGIRREKQEDGEITGKLSVKHIYEIAKIKSTDKAMIGEICQLVIERASEIGIKIQYEDLDPDEYKEFLDMRREVVKQQLEEIAKQEAAKLLRI
uniref:Large ribosomal subunit protein uL11m n=2 Tax=Meloidogyne incognita group TaxID=654580 RepID=A0A915MQ96_MELJA